MIKKIYRGQLQRLALKLDMDIMLREDSILPSFEDLAIFSDQVQAENLISTEKLSEEKLKRFAAHANMITGGVRDGLPFPTLEQLAAFAAAIQNMPGIRRKTTPKGSTLLVQSEVTSASVSPPKALVEIPLSKLKKLAMKCDIEIAKQADSLLPSLSDLVVFSNQVQEDHAAGGPKLTPEKIKFFATYANIITGGVIDGLPFPTLDQLDAFATGIKDMPEISRRKTMDHTQSVAAEPTHNSAVKSADIEMPFLMQSIEEGRVFYRQLKDNKSCLLGVVRIPSGPWLGDGAHARPMECLMAARLNDKLWLDLQHPDPLKNHIHWEEAIPEMTPNDFMTGMQWRSGALKDALQIGLREAPIPNESGGKWAIVFAAIDKRLDAMPKDGVYELSAQGLKLVDDRAFIGSGVNQVLREPIWGPGGQLGLVTGMRHDTYHAFVEKDRERSAKRNPEFAEFMNRIKELDDLPLAYTAPQLAEREEASKRIINSIYARERINEMESLAKTLGIKPT